MSEVKTLPEIFYLKHGSKEKHKCHVISRVESGGETIITYKWYSKIKQSWIYKAEEQWLLLYTLDLQNR